jgi:tetratricopeptide (TPR) repeat protein
LPFDLAPFRTTPYKFSPQDGLLNPEEVIKGVAAALVDAKLNKTVDSPVYQLVDGIQFQNSLAHEKTDIFRDRIEYDHTLKNELRIARETPGGKADKAKAIDDLVASKLQPVENYEAALLIDVMLSYRDVSAFEKMEAFIEKLPRHIRETIMVQEQYGFALNRNKKRKRAVEVLEKVIADNGPSSETCGILGRVYKDYIVENYDKGDIEMATSYIDDALSAYKKGFEADWRDGYPGINYVTCLELKGDRDAIKTVMPVVEYSVLRKKEKKKPDYWDEATLAELAVISNRYDDARKHMVEAKKTEPVEWMLQSTNKNFTMIKDFREKRGENNDELKKIIEGLPKP